MTGLYAGVLTRELDALSAEICASLTTKHYDYGTLAARICVSNLHKETRSKFSDVMEDLYSYVNPKTKLVTPMVSDELINIVRKNTDLINNKIEDARDFNFNFFGLKVFIIKIELLAQLLAESSLTVFSRF